MGESVFGTQCEVCGWKAVADGESIGGVSRRAIDRYTETGHLPIERFEFYDRSIVERYE